MATPDGHKIYGYCRASTKKQAESPEVQKGQIAAYVKMKGLGPVDAWFVDTAASGAVDLIRRTAGRELYLRLKEGDTVVFSKLDRAFRKIYDCVGVLDELSRKGVKVHFCDANGQAIDLSSPMGRFVTNILAAFAELERAMISERTREALAAISARGGRAGREAPLGFKWMAVKRHGVRKFVRTPNPEERAVMSEIVAMHESGMSLREIERNFAERGVLNLRSPNGPAHFGLVRIHAYEKAELALRERERQYARRASEMGEDGPDDDRIGAGGSPAA